MKSERGMRHTTALMQAAPRNAVFVWCASHTEYARDLAKHLGRFDLLIVSPSWLEKRNICGRTFAGIVIDHATELSNDQWRTFQEANQRIDAAVKQRDTSKP